MASCGISLNLSRLESKITANISAALGIAGAVGLPYATTGLLVGIALANGNFMAAIKIVVPSDALDGLWSGMRSEFTKAFNLSDVPANISDLQSNMANAVGASSFDEIGVAGSYTHDALSDPGLAGLWGGTDTFLGKLGEIGSEFVSDAKSFAEKTGLDQLSGYVDINVTDLAKTAIGLGASWDSCDFGTAGIQNYFKDPATGTVKLLANYAPKLGDTSVAKGNSVWGLTANVNAIFQTGKGSFQTQLNVALGDVVSSGVNYALDSITGSTSIDSRDVSNIKQYIGDYVSPSYLQRLRRTRVGLELFSTTSLVHEVQRKITGVFRSREDMDTLIEDAW